LRFINWLEKLVQHNPKNRYANATAALEALKPIYVIRIPEVQLSQSSLGFKAFRLGERLAQTIRINNSIPETVLEGRWEVAPHPSDPPHTPKTHSWIKVTPAKRQMAQLALHTLLPQLVVCLLLTDILRLQPLLQQQGIDIKIS